MVSLTCWKIIEVRKPVISGRLPRRSTRKACQQTVADLLDTAEPEGVTPARAADEPARRRLHATPLRPAPGSRTA